MRVQHDVAPAALLKVGGAVLAAWLVVKVWPVLVLVLISLMLVATFNPVVRRLQTRFNRTGAITAVTLGVLLLSALLVMLMIPPLVSQTQRLLTDAPRYAEAMEAAARRAGVPMKLSAGATDWIQGIAAMAPQLVGLFTNVVSGIGGAVTVAVLTVYLLIDGPRVEVELMRLLPRAERRPVRQMLDEIATQVGAYMRCQLFASERRTTMAPGCPDRLVPPAAARTKELAPIPARQAARASRRPDLSAPFTVMLMTGLMSAGLFLSVVVQRGVPLERVLPLAVADPFGAMALALIAAAGVMAGIGDI